MTEHEGEIISAIRNGQRERFGELYDAYVARIYAYLFRRVSHRETAKDLTSTVFMKAVDKVSTFRSGSFSAWLYTIAHHTLVDHYRTHHPNLDMESIPEPVGPVDLEQRVDQRQQLVRVRQQLQTLPAHVQDIITLRVWDDLPFADIARIVGKSPAAVKMTFARGIQKLQPTIFTFLLIYSLLVTYGRLA